MAGVYLETSALGRVMLDEPDAGAIGAAPNGFDAVVSSRLLRIELHRLGVRADVTREEIETWLAGVSRVPMDDAILSAAEAVSPASVATLDAILSAAEAVSPASVATADAIRLATALALAVEQHVATIMTTTRGLRKARASVDST